MAFLNNFMAPVTALASATSAQDAARNGATLDLGQVAPGTLVVQGTVTIVTGSVVATFKPQVSMDASTWYNLKLPNNAAAVTVAATENVALTIPAAASAFRYFRCVVTLSGASTAGGDLTAMVYRARRYLNG